MSAALPPFAAKAEGDGWFLAVRVQPGAKKSEYVGVADNRLRIRLAAPAVENKANKALSHLLLKHWACALQKFVLSLEKQVASNASSSAVRKNQIGAYLLDESFFQMSPHTKFCKRDCLQPHGGLPWSNKNYNNLSV